jgi:hypothetical protein
LIDFSTRAHGDFGIAVGRYVILPDHIHLFVAGRTISILENGSVP